MQTATAEVKHVIDPSVVQFKVLYLFAGVKRQADMGVIMHELETKQNSMGASCEVILLYEEFDVIREIREEYGNDLAHEGLRRHIASIVKEEGWDLVLVSHLAKNSYIHEERPEEGADKSSTIIQKTIPTDEEIRKAAASRMKEVHVKAAALTETDKLYDSTDEVV